MSQFYYEINPKYQKTKWSKYISIAWYDAYIASISDRIFQLDANCLICIHDSKTKVPYHIEPQETTFILLKVKNFTTLQYDNFYHFDPGHA